MRKRNLRAPRCDHRAGAGVKDRALHPLLATTAGFIPLGRAADHVAHQASLRADLLAEVAVSGFQRLHDGLATAVADLQNPPDAFVACLSTYVRLGMENPALYRLMFGPELTAFKEAKRPPKMVTAGNDAKAILSRVIGAGARSGDFVSLLMEDDKLALSTFVAWSAVHGLTMLVIDNLTGINVSAQAGIEAAIEIQLSGLRYGASHALDSFHQSQRTQS